MLCQVYGRRREPLLLERFTCHGVYMLACRFLGRLLRAWWSCLKCSGGGLCLSLVVVYSSTPVCFRSRLASRVCCAASFHLKRRSPFLVVGY